MNIKFNKNLYVNKLDKNSFKVLLTKVNKLSLFKEEKKNLTTYKINDVTVNLHSNGTVCIQGKNVVNVVKTFNLPFIRYEKENENTNKLTAYAGCDEAGTGWFFGGICASLAFVNDEIKKKLNAYKITDSKKLDDKYIFEIAPKIEKICNCISYEMSPNEYNNLYMKYKNANIIKTYAHDCCISKLRSYSPNSIVVMDKYCSESKYKEYLNKINPNFNYNDHKINIFETNAEKKYLAVGAASIVARWKFINQFKKLSKIANISNFPMGSTNIFGIKKAIGELKQKYSENKLKDFLKLNFSLN